ncbi:uncharacterized protein MYCFIDRAFT_173545 [Pseudocercospora fijiensis CIRAD86]|uniref:Peptidase S8/S53 domain-containing protein n=1 Tax=Pseudocercospora fijiensis (strain CIRAD86) TaxID=383855 RepID=M3A090_PSEFD|nr:uncharacterized protein MYCFIDRAFT_173545 [Pseudocercospora fijiensis CIRAD86]EME84584.1 hypothetical protein MYCFIDRAFT_173545 [Pseudocercospora fijiensis CIRAD86]
MSPPDAVRPSASALSRGRHLPLRHRARRESEPHPPHAQIGVDRLHAAGITGKGIRIAILDTGFDYKQQPFGHDIGPDKKVTYAHDWIGDSDDPYTECSHHGTHVMGIVAADRTHFGVVGAAPDATIELHRVFDCDGHTDEDTLFSALTAAWQRGVDVINCSWGLSDSFEAAISTLAARIMANGTYVQFTAGNAGPRPFTISTPGATHGVPAVGSVDCESSAAYFWNGSFFSNGVQHSIRWVPGLTNYTVTEFPSDLDVWAPLETVPENSPWRPVMFPANLSIPDMEETVLLIRLDFFAVYHQHIVDLIKPRYILTYHPMPGDLAFPGMYFPSWPLSDFPDTKALATVEHETALHMLHEISQGRRVIITLAQKNAYTDDVAYAVNLRTGGRMTENSGWGPTMFGEAGVTFAAPGGRILSTLPRLYGGFGQLTGTSMAAPLVTGVVALMKQLHPDWTPDMMRNVLATTAHPMPYTDNSTRDYGLLAPVIQQGGGLIDALSAAYATTIVNVSVLDFLDLSRKPSSLSFSLTNVGNETVSFGISHIGAASGYAKMRSEDMSFADDKYLDQSRLLMAAYANVQVYPTSLTVDQGQTAVVRVTVTPPAGLNPSRLPFFGGYIALNSTDGTQNLTVPYSGIAARLPKDLPLVDAESVKSAMYRPEDESWSGCDSSTKFELVGFNNTLRFSSGAWPAVTFSSPLLQIQTSRVSMVNVMSGQEIIKHTLTPEDWRAKKWYWNGDSSSREHTLVSEGRYFWRLKHSGLLARNEEDYTTIDTDPFFVGYSKGDEQYHRTLPEFEDTPCEIEAAEGFRSW